MQAWRDAEGRAVSKALALLVDRLEKRGEAGDVDLLQALRTAAARLVQPKIAAGEGRDATVPAAEATQPAAEAPPEAQGPSPPFTPEPAPAVTTIKDKADSVAASRTADDEDDVS